MTQHRIILALFLIMMGALAVATPAHAANALISDGQVRRVAIEPIVFPRPEALEGQIGFWSNVYGRWTLGQVALHDLDYPGVVYEVVDLPGSATEGYTSAQKNFIDDRRKALQLELRQLEQNYKTPALLTEAQRDLLLQITRFAGDDAVVGAADRVRSQRGLRERFRRGLEISGRYDATFRNIFSEAGLPQDLAYLPHVESSFQTHARSSAGAVGIWQFTRGAARLFLKLNPAVDERLDPVASARGAARYLSHAHGALGDWAFALTSYNHGIEGMMRAKKAVGSDFAQVVRDYQSRSFGFASKNFYTEFLAARDVAQQPEQFFQERLQYETPLSAKTVLLDRKISAVHLAKTHDVSLKDLADANPAWTRRAARGEIPLPAGIHVWLPSGTRVASTPNGTLAAAKAPQMDVVTAPVATSRNVHVVRRSETLFGIADRYGLTIAQLRELNNIAVDSSLVRIGQKLRVVAPEAEAAPDTPALAGVDDATNHVFHVVRKGETPIEIATSYGVSVARLLSHNDLNRQSVIYPGQRFRIPLQ